MERIWIFCMGAAFLLAAGAALFYRYREKNTLKRMDRMLDEAINGDFRESDFDESLLSAVESKLAQYLSASVVSARNLSEEKDKIKTLVSDISHQTKTPLANILLYSELLEEQPLSAEGQGFVDALGGQARKLQFLIAALVKTSRLETGILTLHPKNAPVRPMLERAVSSLQKKALEKNISLNINSGDGQAVFDGKWTEEAVANLIDNAVKYTPAGGKITLNVKDYDLFCRINVQDNGIGIPEAEQPKIFSRFYRAESAAEQDGVGIGLYLVRQIAAGQGGYVKVTSAPGEGAVFSLFLPKR